MGDIIVGGKRWPVVAPVELWDDTGLETTPGRGARKRKRAIDLGVFHWTGGEGGAQTLFRVLTKRQLGVEFYIGHDGTIWQFCDPALVDTFDAGRVNDRSFGAEIANYGFRGRGKPIPRKGLKRPQYNCDLNGRRRKFAHFWPAQIAAALSLADAMSKACSIPRAVPESGGGYWVEPNTLSAERLDAFKGHLGHFHITSRKSDPGMDLLETFLVAWAGML